MHNQYKLTEAINEIKVQIQQLKVHTNNNQLSISKLMTLPQIAQSKSDNDGFESHQLNKKNDEYQVANELQEEERTLQHAIKRLDSLTYQFQKHQTETSIVITELLDLCETRNTPTQNDHILRENTLPKETNEALKAELLEYKSTITQINAKVTTAENETASLLTVIRVLNEDRAVTISPKQGKEIISPSRTNSDVASASQPAIIDHNISLNNRYSCLDTANGDKASMDGNGYAATHSKQKESDVVEVISSASTGVSQQQGNTDNTGNNNTTLQPTNSNNNHSNKTSTVKTVRENNDKRAARDSPIILIGDSIVKNINPGKISKRRVGKRTFPGKNAEEIKSEINFISTEPNPSHVIIHAGTNNIPNDTVGECVENIENLANCVEQIFPNSLIGLSI